MENIQKVKNHLQERDNDTMTEKERYYKERLLYVISILERNLSKEERKLWNDVFTTYLHLYSCKKQHRFEFKPNYCIWK